jgi:uncharacterized protein YbjT (DUF2867 family)
MILVTGATGNAGGAVVSALVAAGTPVRALVRRPSAADLPEGVEVAVGDLDTPDSLRGPLAGARGLFLLAGYRNIEATLALARAAGVEHVVLLSSSAAPSGDLGNAVARYHILSERAIQASGLPWTFIRPNAFMSNAYRWKPQLAAGDVVRLPFANVRTAAIDPDDLGAVIAAVFASSEHAGRAYRVSGPESLLPADQVRILGEALGRALRFEPQSDAEARADMSSKMPAEYVDAFFKFYVDGDLDESQVLPTFEQITGRRPATFAQWARAHASAFPEPAARTVQPSPG